MKATWLALVVSLSGLLSGLFPAQAVAAQAAWNVAKDPQLSAQVDALYGYYDAPHTPGAIVAVLQRGEVVHLRGYGHANREFDAPWTPDTLYTFFSTTKAMTCLALIRLADQGKLSLDDEIQAWLPDFPRFGHAVTVRHLLNHTSGLWQDESLLHLAGTGVAYQPVSLDELYQLNRKQASLPYAPGSNWYYNDAGTRLAARIIETITGQDFDTAMRALVFAPAGMHSARIKAHEPMYFPNQASTYLLSDQPRPDPATGAVRVGGIIVETSGDGAGNGSMNDYIAYARYLTAPQADGRRWIDRLTEPRKANAWHTPAYRYGFLDETHRGLRVIHHGGYYGKRIAYLPELDTWVLVMRNGLDYDVANDVQRMTQTIDAVLQTARGGYYLSDRNPDRNATLGVPRDQHWTADERRRITGSFVEPQSGFVIRIAPSEGEDVVQLRYVFHDADGVLVRAGKGRDYTSYTSRIPNAVRLVDGDGGLSLQYADWPAPRRLQPVAATRAFTAADMDALVGWYRNDALGVHYRIVRADVDGVPGLQLQINGGNRQSERFALQSVSAEVFEARPSANATYLNLRMSARIERVAGQPLALVFTGVDVKDLRLHKLDGTGSH